MAASLIVVGAAILRGGGAAPGAPALQVLAAQRSAPPALAGGWEFVGGKVEPGENEIEALHRECREELEVEIAVGERVGHDVPIGSDGAILRVWTARVVGGELKATEHQALRWLPANELYDVPWLSADLPVVAALQPLLSRG